MANESFDLRVSRLQKVCAVHVSDQDAHALQRCLELEQGVVFTPARRFTQILFRMNLRDAPTVRALCFENTRERVLIEVERQRPQGVQQDALELPRSALKMALRGKTARELLPALPEDPQPIMAVTGVRRTFTHPKGWCVHVDAGLCFHALARAALSSEAASPSRRPFAAQSGSLFTLHELSLSAPDWLSETCARLPRFDLLPEALALAAEHGALRHPPDTFSEGLRGNAS